MENLAIPEKKTAGKVAVFAMLAVAVASVIGGGDKVKGSNSNTARVSSVGNAQYCNVGSSGIIEYTGISFTPGEINGYPNRTGVTEYLYQLTDKQRGNVCEAWSAVKNLQGDETVIAVYSANFESRGVTDTYPVALLKTTAS